MVSIGPYRVDRIRIVSYVRFVVYKSFEQVIEESFFRYSRHVARIKISVTNSESENGVCE